MKITIYQNREVYKEESKIGNDSENKVETLEFGFPEEYRDFTKYIEFQIKGEKYVDLIEDNKYVITREVAKYGKIKTQVVLKKNTENDVMIFKSDVFTLTVSNSINATENLVHTVGIDLIEKIVTKNNEQDARLDILEADNTTNKEDISNLQQDNTTNKSNIKSLQDDNETNKTDIQDIKQEQTTQNTNISNLQTDNTSNKAKILDLEAKNTEQDTNIQKNTDDIAEINAKNTAQDGLIEELQTENTKLKKEINSMQIPGEATGNPIHLSDSSNMECEIVPIGGAEQETREGYNLLIPPATQTKNGITFTVNDDNSITVNGTATENASINFVNSSGSTMLSFEAGTYKLTGCPEGGSNTTYRMGMNLNGDSFDTGDGAIITTSKDVTNKAVWLIVYKGTTVNNLKFYPMLIKGTEEKPYEQYGASPSPDYPSEIVTVGQNGSVEIEVVNNDNTKSQTAIMPIQQEMLEGDYIKDVEHHEWGKAILSGNEDVIIDGTYSGITQFKIAILNVKKQSNPSEICVLSNYFLGVEWNNSWTKNNSIVNRSDNSVRVMTSKYTTIDGFKAWLKSKYDEGNPVVIYYKLEKPINLELTSEQKAVRNQKLYTYKNITNISVDGIGTLKVNYKKDLETIINNLSATSVAE